MPADLPPFRALPQLAQARRDPVPASRLRRLRRAADAAREAILSEGNAEAFTACPLVTFPYPTVFALMGAALTPAPYVMLTHWMHVVQFRDESGRLRTLLFNPTDWERSLGAPFYASLRQRLGDFLSDRVFSKRCGTVEGHLTRLGLQPRDIDYIAFDHLHLQDLRRWLGGGETPAYFPRAKLLIQRAEWESARDLHPLEQSWYVPGGTDGVPQDRVVLLEGDAWLGRGVAIVSTPGHTLGNMSLAVATPSGLYVVSENAVATEGYTPLVSGIPGVRRWAERYGHEVIQNGNTRESSIEQYTSMVLEKKLAGPSKLSPSFVNVFPSSELTPSLLSPGASLTFSHGEVSHGYVRRPDRVTEVAA